MADPANHDPTHAGEPLWRLYGRSPTEKEITDFDRAQPYLNVRLLFLFVLLLIVSSFSSPTMLNGWIYITIGLVLFW